MHRDLWGVERAVTPRCPCAARESELSSSLVLVVAKGIWRMQLSHVLPVRAAVFDDATLVSVAGLVPLMGLAERAGLARLAGEQLTVAGGAGCGAGAKVAALVAGMAAGAGSITDMDVLRHGGMGRLFGGVRAPSTLGTFLRCFTHGHVQQLDAAGRRLLAGLAGRVPGLLAGAGQLAFVDVDDTIREVHGYAKQGAA